jgi:hypothetical protein
VAGTRKKSRSNRAGRRCASKQQLTSGNMGTMLQGTSIMTDQKERESAQRAECNVRSFVRSTQQHDTSLVPVLMLCAITRWARENVVLDAHEGLRLNHLLQHAPRYTIHLWTSSQSLLNTFFLSLLVSYNEHLSMFWYIWSTLLLHTLLCELPLLSEMQESAMYGSTTEAEDAIQGHKPNGSEKRNNSPVHNPEQATPQGTISTDTEWKSAPVAQDHNTEPSALCAGTPQEYRANSHDKIYQAPAAMEHMGQNRTGRREEGHQPHAS